MRSQELQGLPQGDGVHRLLLDDGRTVLCKRRAGMPADFFAAEVRGLRALASCGGLRVPAVHGFGADFVLLEDLGDGSQPTGFHASAGRGLARQHARIGRAFGFEAGGWCGDSAQDNTRDDDGYRFFAERRLLPQARRARDAGRLDVRETARVEGLCATLVERIPRQPPVLLHGDLWHGNLHCCGDGTPALIDAGAVHYGWAEAELSMLLLFGAPPELLFATYAEHAPLARDWRLRAPLYNLYHLLNHLNLFGGAYGDAVRRTLDRHA